MTIDERCKRRMPFGDPRPVEQHLTSLPERREVDLDELVAETTKPLAGRLVDAGAFRHAVPFAVARREHAIAKRRRAQHRGRA